MSERWTGEGEAPYCPLCGNPEWAVGYVVEARLTSNPALSHKYIPVDCTMCGYTMFFNSDRIPDTG